MAADEVSTALIERMQKQTLRFVSPTCPVATRFFS